MLSSMLMVSSVLDVSSNSGPSTDDVLFNDLSPAIRLEPRIASKSTFETLSSGTTSGPKVRPDLRCMYDYEVRVVLGFCWHSVQAATVKHTVQVQEIIEARCNNYCSALTNLGSSYTLTGQCDGALAK